MRKIFSIKSTIKQEIESTQCCKAMGSRKLNDTLECIINSERGEKI